MGILKKKKNFIERLPELLRSETKHLSLRETCTGYFNVEKINSAETKSSQSSFFCFAFIIHFKQLLLARSHPSMTCIFICKADLALAPQ